MRIVASVAPSCGWIPLMRCTGQNAYVQNQCAHVQFSIIIIISASESIWCLQISTYCCGNRTQSYLIMKPNTEMFACKHRCLCLWLAQCYSGESPLLKEAALGDRLKNASWRYFQFFSFANGDAHAFTQGATQIPAFFADPSACFFTIPSSCFFPLLSSRSRRLTAV